MHRFLQKYLLDPKDLPLADALAFYIGMPVSTYGAFAICLDLSSALPEAYSKDPVVPVCHCCTPAIGILTNCAI
jgi:hypothetical protein